MQSNREELLERMARILPEDGSFEVFGGLFLGRSSKPMESVHSLHQPAFCFVVQGGKRVLLGEEVFWYDPGHYLVFTVDLPVVFQVEEASEERPYFGIRLNLDPSLVASVMMESGFETKKGDAGAKAIGVSPVDADLLDAVVRLTRLLDTPGGRKLLAPLITREIVYRLLAGGEGARLGHLLASYGPGAAKVFGTPFGTAATTARSTSSTASRASPRTGSTTMPTASRSTPDWITATRTSTCVTASSAASTGNSPWLKGAAA
jgi:hypothetical protein